MSTATGGGGAPHPSPLPGGEGGRRRARRQEQLVFALCAAALGIILAPVLIITALLLWEGLPALTWTFLTQPPGLGLTSGGIFPAIVGTLLLVLGTIVIAMPLGVAGGVYLTEYARQGWLLRVVRLAIVNLAGVPSIVFGLFGLAVFVTLLGFGRSLLAGWLTLALLVLPVTITATEEALLTVPQDLRQASLALGATRSQTVWRVVLPGALPGILTGAIIAVGRAAGETAPILFTVAAFSLPRLPTSVYDQAMALPYQLYSIATQVPNAPPSMKWGTALVLLLLVLGLNLGAIVLRARLRGAKRW